MVPRPFATDDARSDFDVPHALTYATARDVGPVDPGTRQAMILFASLLLLAALPGLWFSLWTAHESGISNGSDLFIAALLLIQFVAMICGAICLLVRTPRTWRIAYLSLFAGTVAPILGTFTETVRTLGSRDATARPIPPDLGDGFVLLLSSLCLAINLGPLMYLTRAGSRWSYQLDALAKPTAKHATWAVGMLWVVLAIAIAFTSALR
jgi:hypothetical protein